MLNTDPLTKFFTLSLAVTLLALPAISEAKRSKIPRQAGAVHSEFKKLIDDIILQFDDGVGRVELVGSSSFTNRCYADLYISEETTYVTLKADANGFYEEFYIDHPKQSFSTILFQNVTTKGEVVSIRVDEKNGGYSIEREEDTLKINRRVDKKKSPACKFSLKKAKLYSGETE